MSKRMLIITVALCLVAFVAGFGFAAFKSVSSEPEFASDGYVLSQKDLGVDRIAFGANERFKVTNSGVASFKSGDDQVKVSSQSFAMLDNGSVMAMSDGVLLDFNDLSDNFINHYFISAKLPIFRSGDTYTANTKSGDITFGDHMWKLSDQKYLIESPKLEVVFSEEDKRPVENYVQVNITDDGIVQLLTEENLWMTISEDCYIETESGVKIYPLSKMITTDDYKLSMAKLSVTPEDSIVLTEDETRRQIVPELNIETIDGKNGTDGNEGDAGQTGVEGSSGEKGEAGDNGTTGTEGQDGTEGDGGVNGSDGSRGEGGRAGADGQSGSDGKSGGGGKRGENAKVSSSTNTALPTMSLELEQTATSVRGKITIEDENDYLKNGIDKTTHPATVTITDVATGETIACYQVSEGENVTEKSSTDFSDIYSLANVFFATRNDALKPDTLYNISVTAYYKANETVFQREFITRDFYTDSTGVYLQKKSAENNSVTINVTSIAGLDKAEIFLLTQTQNQTFDRNQANGQNWKYKYVINYSDGTYELIRGGDADFYAILEGPTSFPEGTDIYNVDALIKDINMKYEIPSDTRFIARVRVVGQGLDVVTSQELECTTLKDPPLWEDGEKPRAGYNRVTGGFEIYRPTVKDVDGGVVSYEYTACDVNGVPVLVNNEPVTRTLRPNEGEPAVFYLDSGVDYKFAIKMKFFDNEKEVVYDMGVSDAVRYEGTSMPKITFQVDKQEYSQYVGDMIITLAGDTSSLSVGGEAGHDLEVNVYADQVYQDTAHITGTEPVTNATGTPIYKYTFYPADPGSTNEAKLHMEFKNLLQNTNYTVTVTGYIDVGDGNGPTKRVIGIGNFRTYDTIPLRVLFTNSTGTTSISAKLKLVPENPESTATETETDPRVEYAASKLKNGKIELKLYHGSGTNMTLKSTATLPQQHEMEEIFSEGKSIDITEATFGYPDLVAGDNYTIVITEVADETVGMSDLGYKNTFSFLGSTRLTLTTNKKAPDLTLLPAEAVEVIPILNMEASANGGVKDSSLPDDALVGYKLISKYDNSDHLALSVSYYAMEYRQFYSACARETDRLDKGEINTLMATTVDVTKDQNDVPGVIYFFGKRDGYSYTEMPYSTTVQRMDNGENKTFYVYYAGDAEDGIDGDALVSGMGRGFRYIFAYTVRYDPNGTRSYETSQVYPYDHADYAGMVNKVGTGTVFGLDHRQDERGPMQFKDKAYILNSGMIEAPRLAPNFYSYIYDIKDFSKASGATGATTGKAVLHYTYKFGEEGIVSTGESGTAATMIMYDFEEEPYGVGKIKYGDLSDTRTQQLDEDGWYASTIPFKVESGEDKVLDVSIDLNYYAVSYESIVADISLLIPGFGQEKTYLCHIPLDYNWEAYFTEQLNTDTIIGNIDTASLPENYITISVDSSYMSGINVELGQKAYVMKTTFTPVRFGDEATAEQKKAEEDALKKNSKIFDPKTFYLPLTVEPKFGSCYTKFTTGQLPGDWMDHFIKVSAEIYYDSGLQGWKLMETGAEEKRFGLQQCTTKTGESSLASYLVANSTAASLTNLNSPRGGLMSIKSSSEFLSSVRAKVSSFTDAKSLIPTTEMVFHSVYSDGDYVTARRYERASYDGINVSTNTQYMGDNSYTVKGVATYMLGFNDDQFELTTITPTINEMQHTKTTTTITPIKFTIDGLPESKVIERKVYAALFPNETAAINAINNKGNAWEQAQQTLVFDMSESNTYRIGGDVENAPHFEDLIPGTAYYIVYYMELMNGGVQTRTVLLDYQTSEHNLTRVETSESVNISSRQGLVYGENQNIGYYDKVMDFDFTVEPFRNMNYIRFDFYDEEGLAGDPYEENGKRYPPTLSHEEMVEAKMLTEFKGTDVSANNTQKFLMQPSETRKKLEPGKTYYLRVEAYEQGKDTFAGFKVFPVTIPPVGVPDAYIKASAATNNSITFQVTINDPQYSIMGAGYDSEQYKEGVGLYMVRFSYYRYDPETGVGKEVWMPTRYDNFVYSEAEIKKGFTLNSKDMVTGIEGSLLNGKTLVQNEQYTMYVYAVTDLAHRGSVENIPGKMEGKDGKLTWKDFYGDLREPSSSERWDVVDSNVAPSFAALLDSFWNPTGGANLSEMDPIEDRFLLSTKTQKVTDDNGILLNKDAAVLRRLTVNDFELLFPESFGLDQAFKKIKWDIKGTTTAQAAVREIYEVKSTDGDTLIQKLAEPDKYNYEYYYKFQKPGNESFELSNGTYQVVVQFFVNDTDTVPAEKISLTFYAG